ncbi:hypothetical protein JCM5350_007221 [Sporobolomyces pararoseus]
MGLLRLLILSSLMLISTLVASFAPFYLNLSPRKVQLVSTYSTGLLVGAALTVVIPEGVATVYASLRDSEQEPHSHQHEHEHEEGVSGWIGASLLAGYILMQVPFLESDERCQSYIIDSVTSHGHGESHPTSQNPPPSLRHMPSHLSELEPLSPPRTSTDSESHPDDPSSSNFTIRMHSPTSSTRSRFRPHREPHPAQQSSAISLLLGLLFHSLSDGISLGASTLSSSSASDSPSSPSSSSSLSSVIFLAIMLHKAPTAFALSNLLNSTATASKSFIKRGLILFSLSAPVGAIVTYLLLKLLVGNEAGEGSSWWTGLTLVFSGGTFLFVATSHVTSEQTGGQGEENGQTEAETIGTRMRLGFVLAGMITPGILSKLVGHGH